jgi:hypothetical protein
MFANRREARDYSREIAEVEQLLRQLERRVGNLTGMGVRTAASGANQLLDSVSRTFSDLADSFRGRYRANATAMAGDAAKYGQDALRRVANEAEHHPLLTLAVAVGVGFLAGMAARRD